MAEIKVGPQKKAESEVVVELINAMRYVYRGKMYQYGYRYKVSPELADELLADDNDKGMPYFRAVVGTAAEGAIAPPVKALKKKAKKKPSRRSRRAAKDFDDSGEADSGGDDGIEIA